MTLKAQFVKFATVGALATLIQYAVLAASVELLRWSPVVGSSIGFVVSAVCNYLINRRFTFQSRRRHVEAGPRFALVAFVGLWINAAGVWIGVDVVEIHYILAQVAATLVALGWTFFANRYWTFGIGHIDTPRKRSQ